MTDSKTVVEDLAAWLTAVWDERQRVFEYPPDFVEDSGSARGPGWGKIGGDTCEVCDSYQFSGYESVVEDAWYEHMEQYHQRTEVLARIAADRKILARLNAYCWERVSTDGGKTWHLCGGCDRVGCAALRDMASAYLGRPDFPEWLVERQGVEG